MSEEREEIEEVEEAPRRRGRAVNAWDYSPHTPQQAAHQKRQLEQVEREEDREQVERDYKELARERAERLNNGTEVPGMPKTAWQADRERAIEDAYNADQGEEVEETPVRRKAWTTGRVGDTLARHQLEEDYEEWLVANDLHGNAASAAAFLKEQEERDQEDGHGQILSELPEEKPEEVEEKHQLFKRGVKGGLAKMNSAIADLDRRFKPQEREERESKKEAPEEVSGWLTSSPEALEGWKTGVSWGLDEWINTKEDKASWL